jgi:hypothetical protein
MLPLGWATFGSFLFWICLTFRQAGLPGVGKALPFLRRPLQWCSLIVEKALKGYRGYGDASGYRVLGTGKDT